MVFGVVLLIFALFAVAIIWRPATVLGLAICIYPFEQWAQANSGFFAAHAAFINYGLGVLTLFAVAMVTFRGRNPLNPMTGTMWIWMAMYVFAGVVSGHLIATYRFSCSSTMRLTSSPSWP